MDKEENIEAPPPAHLSVLASLPSVTALRWQMDLCQVNPRCKQGLFLGQGLL